MVDDKESKSNEENNNRAIKKGLYALALLTSLGGIYSFLFPNKDNIISLYYMAISALILLSNKILSFEFQRDKDGTIKLKMQLEQMKENIDSVRELAEKSENIALLGVGKNMSGMAVESGAITGQGAIKLNPPTLAATGTVSGDMQKGKWGGKNINNELLLSAKVTSDKEDEDWFKIVLCVESTAPQRRPLKEKVRFHLHETFKTRMHEVRVREGKATLKLYAWGAFTVGAEADFEPGTKEGKTKLELDLATLHDAPQKFKDN